MAQRKIIDNVKIQLRYDNAENWKTMETILDSGEVGFSKSSSYNVLFVGDGSKNMSELEDDERCFYSGRGANLPIASVNTLGGIKIIGDYFRIDSSSGEMQPKMLVYNKLDIQENKSNNMLTLVENYTGTPTDLFINGDLYFNNGYGKTLTVDTLIKKEETSLKIDSNYIDVHIKTAGNALPPVLKEDEYVGIKLHNYKGDEADYDESKRSVAEIRVDKDGVLQYTPNSNMESAAPGQSYKIALIDQHNKEGFLKLYEDMSYCSVSEVSISDVVNIGTLTLNINSVEHIYDPNESTTIDIAIPTTYCGSLTLSGVQYYPDQYQNIDLGDSIWNSTLNEKLQSAVQKIIFNNREYTGPEITINCKLSSSDNSIDIEEDSNGFDIKHYATETINYNNIIPISKDIINSQELEIISAMSYDDRGHINTLVKQKINFETLINRIEELEKRVEELEAR